MLTQKVKSQAWNAHLVIVGDVKEMNFSSLQNDVRDSMVVTSGGKAFYVDDVAMPKARSPVFIMFILVLGFNFYFTNYMQYYQPLFSHVLSHLC